MTRRILIASGLCAVLASGVLVSARQDLTQAEGDSMEQKLRDLPRRRPAAAARARLAVPRRTSFTEREVNAYLKYNGQSQLPPGVVDPQVTIADARPARRARDRRSRRRAQVEGRGLLDPAGLLTRPVEVHVIGTLHARTGKGTFDLAVGDARRRADAEEPAAGARHATTRRRRRRPNGCRPRQAVRLPASIQSRRDAARRRDRRPVSARCPPTDSGDAAAVPARRRPAARRRSRSASACITVEDLLLRFPLRYEDRADLRADRARCGPAQVATVVGEVLSTGCAPRGGRASGSSS